MIIIVDGLYVVCVCVCVCVVWGVCVWVCGCVCVYVCVPLCVCVCVCVGVVEHVFNHSSPSILETDGSLNSRSARLHVRLSQIN